MVNLTIRLSKPIEAGKPHTSTLVPHLAPSASLPKSASFKEPSSLGVSSPGRGSAADENPQMAKGAGFIAHVAGVDILGRKSSRSNGRKVHFCFRCDFPIAVYGRLEPCHHAFCLTCASTSKHCPICNAVSSAIEEIDYHEGLFICGIPDCLISFPSRQLLLSHVVDLHADLTKTKPSQHAGDSDPNVTPTESKPHGQSITSPPSSSSEPPPPPQGQPDPQMQSRQPAGTQSASPGGGGPMNPPPLPHMQGGFRPPLPPGPFSPDQRMRLRTPMEGDGFRNLDGGPPQGQMGMNMGEFRPMGMHMGPPRAPMQYPHGMGNAHMGYDGGPRRAPAPPYGGGAQQRPADVPGMEGGYGWGGMGGGGKMGAGHAYISQPGPSQNSGQGAAGHGQWRPPMS